MVYEQISHDLHFTALFRDLTDEERHMYIDLRPFMQRTPFLVHANASLSRAYRLFRTMGLHHVFVGPPKPMVMGVITRKVCCRDRRRHMLSSDAA